MSALPQRIALISGDGGLDLSDLSPVAAAIQQQLTTDFGPIWDVAGTLEAFDSLDSVPDGYWHIVVQQDIGQDVAGYHATDEGQPFSLVQLQDGWSVTSSHECLEMLADPFGNRTVAGPTILASSAPQVNYLVEACDPCPNSQYQINGIALSDFVTPHYFDSIASAGVQYSFLRSITQPLQLLEAGYVTFQDPQSGDWFQGRMSNGTLLYDNFGPNAPGTEPLRSWVDTHTRATPIESFRPASSFPSHRGKKRRRTHPVRKAIDKLLAASHESRK